MQRFLPFLLLLFVLALVLRVDLLFTAVWFLLGLYIVMRVWTQRAVRQLHISRHFVERAFSGDEVSIRLVVRNAGRLPVPWLEINESAPMALVSTAPSAQVLTLAGREERTVQYTLICRRRGYYQIGPLRGETGDVLGLEQRVLHWEEPRPLIVYPRVVPLQQLGLPSRSALVVLPARTPLFEDTSRVMGVRDYQPGDSQRRIHWTASARTGQLLVKQYQPAIARDTLLCLDMNLPSYGLRQRDEAAETAIVVAASLARHMIVQEHLPAGLATEAADPLVNQRRRFLLPPRAERAHLTTVLELLARIQLAPGGGFAGLLREESVHLAWGATMVAITGCIDDELAETTLYLKRRGHAMALILVQPAWMRGGDREPPAIGVPIHRVWTDVELAAWT